MTIHSVTEEGGGVVVRFCYQTAPHSPEADLESLKYEEITPMNLFSPNFIFDCGLFSR